MIIKRIGRRNTIIAVVLIVVGIVGANALVQAHDDGCEGDSVFHLPAGTCMVPDTLIVTGEREQVDAAIAPFGGQIGWGGYPTVWRVRFPDVDLDGLDTIKAALTAVGLEIRYALVGQLFGQSG